MSVYGDLIHLTGRDWVEDWFFRSTGGWGGRSDDHNRLGEGSQLLAFIGRGDVGGGRDKFSSLSPSFPQISGRKLPVNSRNLS